MLRDISVKKFNKYFEHHLDVVRGTFLTNLEIENQNRLQTNNFSITLSWKVACLSFFPEY